MGSTTLQAEGMYLLYDNAIDEIHFLLSYILSVIEKQSENWKTRIMHWLQKTLLY